MAAQHVFRVHREQEHVDEAVRQQCVIGPTKGKQAVTTDGLPTGPPARISPRFRAVCLQEFPPPP